MSKLIKLHSSNMYNYTSIIPQKKLGGGQHIFNFNIQSLRPEIFTSSETPLKSVICYSSSSNTEKRPI